MTTFKLLVKWIYIYIYIYREREREREREEREEREERDRQTNRQTYILHTIRRVQEAGSERVA
jgi:hypothetical protein